MKKRAVTLMEVLIALVLLTVIMAGLVNLFISGKRWMLHIHYRMAGGELGRNFLDPLQMQVRQDQWFAGGNCLTTDVIPPATTDCGFGNWTDPVSRIQYRPNYAISSLGNLRKVVLTISWNERNPNQ